MDHTLPFPDFASSMPAVDRASLDGLSKDEIRAWTLLKSEEYRLLSHTMLSLHNAVAPIHTLPTEVLMKIFGQTWDRRDARRSLALPSVCRRWRTVYLSASEFWAKVVSDLVFNGRHDGEDWSLNMDTRFTDDFVAMVLDRSSSRLIRLTLRAGPTYEGRDVMFPTRALPPMLSPHTNRVVSLNVLTTLPLIHDLFQMMGAGMPSLEVLKVSRQNGVRHTARDLDGLAQDLTRTLSLGPVSDDKLPRLCQLTIELPALFPLVAVKSLREVILTCDGLQDAQGTQFGALDSRALLQGLKKCRGLEVLSFEELALPCSWPSPNEVHILQLRSMKELHIGVAWQPSILSALAVLDPCIPSTALISICTDDFEPDDFSEILPAHLVQHHPFDSIALFVPDREHSNEWLLRCFAADALRLEVDFVSVRQLGNLGLGDVSRTHRITRLAIIQGKCGIGTVPEENWTPFLRDFPHLTHLTVLGRDIPNYALETLDPRAVTDVSDSVPPSSATPMCPSLRYVTLGWEMDGEVRNPTGLGDGPPGSATHRPQDIDAHIERRCSMMREIFERRRELGASGLDALEFYDYERGRNRDVGSESEDELITSSRRDSDTRDPACLAELRDVTGGRVIYRGYLLKVLNSDLSRCSESESLPTNTYWDHSF
ncbi:hypothetical protein LXA43DRAFT_898010 [Ganoderma leucocontextum]|nr:hypothetical protein LXA43DRAFT_898010 [Ganoderma leucocontextum]